MLHSYLPSLNHSGPNFGRGDTRAICTVAVPI